jgi:hypothetical protein
MRKTTIIVAFATALSAAAALGAEIVPAACEVPEDLIQTGRPLPHLAAALSRPGPATIVFYGTSSTAGAGTASADKAFPARFGQELAKRFANVAVVVKAQRGRTAADMVADIKADAMAKPPALVIWQTGTTDAVRNVELDSFGDALEHGISYLHARDIDVVLIDPQFSPRTNAVVDVTPYQDYMEQIAERADVMLFRRYDIMHFWIDSGRLSFDDRSKAAQLKAAEQVHDCIGRQLAVQIARAIDEAKAGKH